MIKLCGFVKNFNEGSKERNGTGFLEGCLEHLKKFCDYIVVADCSSSDDSIEIIKKYTDDFIVVDSEFTDELMHKQKLLDFTLEKHPDINWFCHLDPDERFTKPEKIKPLLEKLEKTDVSGVETHLINLWMSNDKFRINDLFNRLWKVPIFRNNGKLRFPDVKSLHQPQHPIGIEKIYVSDLEILHYGFSEKWLIQKKYDTYKSHGQSGFALERLNPDGKAKLKPLIKEYKKPDVTVGVPCYNPNLEYLKECLNSIIEQEYNGEIEIIVVDDGSDNGEEIRNICDVLGARYIRNQENKGIGFTRNVCINECKSDFLCFLSCDDYYLPDYIKTMLGSYDEGAFYYSDYHLLNGNRLMEYRTPIFRDHEDFVFAVLSAARNNQMFVCYNLMAPLKLWKEVPFWPDKKYGEDLSHLLEALMVKKKRFVHVLKPIYVYRCHPQMTTSIIMKDIPGNNRDTFNRINKMLGVDVL
jgi:glycosyltransferase involved in cell wall biosynthesis